MGWVIGFIVVFAVLVVIARRRNRRDRQFDTRTQERIGTHGVEVQGIQMHDRFYSGPS